MEWDWVATPEGWIALLTLVSLEIVLGIDNIVFISILADKLPASQRALARRLGLSVRDALSGGKRPRQSCRSGIKGAGRGDKAC